MATEAKIRGNFHQGQLRAWNSEARFVVVTAGAQSGKTCFEPVWLDREWQRCGKGDYLAVSATFPLLDMKLQPELINYFCHLRKVAVFKESKRVFEMNDGSRIICGSATNPESIESATAKAAVLDEVGQKQFKREVWEGVQRRLSISQGRALLATTVYNLGWLKTDVVDRALAGDKDYEHIQFDSTENPAFPQAEFERAKRTLPVWKFDMQYRGMFTKPAGLIYDAFDARICKVKRFPIPAFWKSYVGMDFGPVHTAAMFYALDPDTGYLYAYREYLKGGQTAAQHAAELIGLSKGETVIKRVGGSHTEEGWREAFTVAGWPISEPSINSVDVGIQKVYGWHKLNKLMVFDDLHGYLDQKLRYSRELNDRYEPTDKIEDKAEYHFMDAERYILSDLAEPTIATTKAERGMRYNPAVLQRWEVG